jgi:hypothetical protein
MAVLLTASRAQIDGTKNFIDCPSLPPCTAP